MGRSEERERPHVDTGEGKTDLPGSVKEKENKKGRDLGNDRITRLFRIDRMLSETKVPLTLDTIYTRLCAATNIHTVSRRTVGMDLEFMLTISSDEGFRLSVDDSGKTFRYWIEEGHSLFRRDFTREQAHSLCELVRTISSYDSLAESRLVENLDKVLESTEMGSCTRTIVDMGVKRYGDNELYHKIYHAIAGRHVIKLEYRRMSELGEKGAVRSILFQPCLIRHYAGRWTVIGVARTDGFICKFYFVQIVSVTLTDEHYGKNLEVRLTRHFESVIGTSSPRSLCVKDKEEAQRLSEIETKTEVVVAAHPGWGNYLQSFPLHESQKELARPESVIYRNKFAHLPGEARIFSFKVYVNQEVEAELMRWMDRIEVLAPASLREAMRVRVARLAAMYGNVAPVESGIQERVRGV